MARLTDDDGVDGPFERGMKRAMRDDAKPRKAVIAGRLPRKGQAIAARSALAGSTAGTFFVVACDGITLDLESPVGTRLSLPWRPDDWHRGTDASAPLFSVEVQP